MKVKSIQEARTRYGTIENGVWADEGKWMTVCKMPDYVSAQMLNSATNRPTTKIYLNKDMELPLLRAFQKLKDRGLLSELKTFDGCFMIRDVRGVPGSASCHSYGLAIDINASTNPLGQPPQLSMEVVNCFTEEGFAWGGNFKRKDGMHFSYAWE